MLIGPPRCDSHVTGQQRVSNRFIFRSGRCRPISDTKLDSLVSFLAEETSRLPSFRRRKVTKKRKNASSYPFSPLSLPFLFSLQKFYPSSLLSFKRLISTGFASLGRDRFVPSSSKIRRVGESAGRKRYRGQDSPSLRSGEGRLIDPW